MFYQFQHSGVYEYFCKEYGENFSFPAHLHQSFEFIIILDGEMQITVENEQYTLKKEEALLIFPHQLHTLNGGTSKHLLCIFSPEIVKSFAVKTAKSVPVNNKFKSSRYVADAINHLQDTDSLLKKKAILYAICAEFDEHASYQKKPDDDKNLLSKIFNFVENNYNKNCSLEQLSKETAFSYAYLSRYFKERTDMSFNEYVNRHRIKNACYILHNSDCTILQCALDCGYTSLRSFNRNFKLITGLAPKSYRQSTQKK